MKRFMLALLASTALAVVGSARAADMQARPITKAPIAAPVSGFEGWYIGFSFGYAATSGTHSDSHFGPLSGVEAAKTDWKSGGFVGGNIGFNWRNGNIIFGIEGDVKSTFTATAIANVEGDNTCNGAQFGHEVLGVTSVVGRLGTMVGPSSMIYGLGGYAGAVYKTHRWDCSERDGTNRWLNGWTAGAGYEHKLTQNMSLKLEARYHQFQKKTFTDSGADPSEEIFGFRPKLLTAGLGLNFRF
jgi:outer membrane immunogenic protein